MMRASRDMAGTPRRAVLGGLGAALLAASLPGAVAGRAAQGTTIPGSIVNPQSALAIGRAALAAQVVETDAAALEAALTPQGSAWTADRDQLRADLVARVRADFAAGHLVAVEGWALSRTEARLCALITLEVDCGCGAGGSG